MRVRGLSRVVATTVLLLSFLTGCNADRRTDTVMGDVNPFGWLKEVTLSFDNTDTLSKGDLMLVVRCGSDLDSDRLPLSIEFTAPDSTRFVERKVFPLRMPGKAASSAAVITVPYRRAVRFSQSGRYTVTLRPLQKVCGIEAAGFTYKKIEKTWEKTN